MGGIYLRSVTYTQGVAHTSLRHRQVPLLSKSSENIHHEFNTCGDLQHQKSRANVYSTDPRDKRPKATKR